MASQLSRKTLIIAISFVLVGVALRIMPHPGNLVPIAAISLLGGALLSGRWAILLPAAVMVISDLVLGLNKIAPFTWLSLVVISFLSARLLSRRLSFETVFIACILSAGLFYAATNLGVWVMTDYYPKNLGGLLDGFSKELSFFRNILLGDIIYGSAIYGLYIAASKRKLLKGKIFNLPKKRSAAENK